MAGRMRAVIAGAAVACATLVLAACGTSAPAISPVPAAARPQHSANSSAAATAAVPQAVLAARYLAIARPANERLDHDFDGLGDASRDDLQAAAADLRNAAATERRFDRQARKGTGPSDHAPVIVDLDQAPDGDIGPVVPPPSASGSRKRSFKLPQSR